MTDKEQINKCKCTCDECGAECEPFWKKENKEQIICHGVDVSKCEYLKESFTGLICADCNKSNDCSKSPNCYFKQLVRKTQECEELKIKNNDYLETINSLDYLQSCYKTSYEGARGAIEMIAKDCTDKTAIYYATIALLYLGFAKKSILNNYTKRQNKARGEE